MRKTKTQTLLSSLTAMGLGVALVANAAAPPEPQGFITAKEFRGIGGVNVADLVNSPNYPNNPDAVFYPLHFEWPTGADGRGGPDGTDISTPPGDVLNDYGVEIEGYYYPPSTGTYYFAIASDDGGDLYLSTDDSPANAVQIAVEPTWNPIRAFAGTDRRAVVDAGTANERLQNQSVGINLTGGQPYYIRARMKEGGGGDNLAVAVNTTGPAAFQNGDLPIPGNRLSSIDRLDSASPYFGDLAGRVDGFRWRVFDGTGPGARTPQSATATLNGETIPVTVQTISGARFIVYQITDVSQLPPSGSTHEVAVVLTDSGGNTQAREGSITIPSYATIPGGWRVSNPSQRGMTARVYHTLSGRVGGNFIWGVENALANKFIDPATGEPHMNLVTPDLWEVDVVNWEQNGGDIGTDPANGPDFFNSMRPPGNPRFNTWVPGVFTPDPDNIATEIYGYIELPAGLTEFGVTSDDGFRLSIFSGLNDVRGTVLGQFDGGRGATESRFTVLIEEAGVYPFRLTWWEGGGGASVEWYSFHRTTGERMLVNDPAEPNALPTFRSASGGSSVISKFYPFHGSETVPVEAPVEIVLRNGTPAVNQGSIQLSVDGASVTPNVSASGGEVTVTYLPEGGWRFGRTVNLELSYGVSGSDTLRVVQSSFTLMTQGPNDLPAQGAFVIEAEDWNYDGGQHLPAASTMPYLGGVYNGRGSTRNVDFWNNDGNDSNTYNRTGFDAAEPDRTHYINNVDNLGGRHGQQRPGFQVTENYRIGWVAGTDWNNYTRNIPAGFYNVFAALSYDGTAPGQLNATLFRVTSDPTQPNQTTQQLGTFNAPGSGGWGANDMVMMRNAAGEPAVVRIEAGGPTTLRFNMNSGDFDWFVLTRADEVPPQLVSMSPMNGWTIRQGTAITVVVEDGADPMTVNDFTLFLNNQEVAADVTRDGSLTTISFVPEAPFGTQHTYRVEFPGGQAGASFFLSPLGAPGLFVIEAEDFNFNSGETRSEASVMPYLGGAFDGLGAVAGVDYNSNQNPADTAQIYRDAELSPPMHFSAAPGTVDRGAWELETNFRIGWASTAVWGNYTRNIPDGEYQVWAALSYGGGTADNQSRATLARVTSDPGAPNQTLQALGSFSGPGTGGWGANNLIPLLDGEGAMTTVMLGGTQTLRVTLDSGDLDYIVLHRVGEGSGEPGEGFVNIGVNAQGELVLTWEEGELKSAPSIMGPFNAVQGATSPYVVEPSGSQI